MEIKKLQKRKNFLALKDNGMSVKAPAFFVVLGDGEGAVRCGVTASKKIGNAVKRGRAKRRMRAVFDAVVRLNGACTVLKPFDMNLIARAYVLNRSFNRMVKELEKVLEEAGCVSFDS